MSVAPTSDESYRFFKSILGDKVTLDFPISTCRRENFEISMFVSAMRLLAYSQFVSFCFVIFKVLKSVMKFLMNLIFSARRCISVKS